MLTDPEIEHIAREYAARVYAARHGTDYDLVLRTTLTSPPGVYFQARYAPSRLAAGDGGFFVLRTDGRVVALAADAFASRGDAWPADDGGGEDAFQSELRRVVQRALSG